MRTWIVVWGPEVRRWVLIALVAGIPIVFLRAGTDPFNVPKLALLVVGVACVGALRAAEVAQGVDHRGLRALQLPAAMFAAPLVLSWAASPYRGWSLLGFLGRFQGLVPYVLVVAVGVLVADAFAGEARRLAWALVAGAAVVGGYAVVQVVGADPFTWDAYGAPTEGISTLGNSNFTGGMLGIALPLIVALWLVERRNRRRVLQVGALIVAGWAVARSQGGFAGGLAGMLVVGGFVLARRYRWAPVVAVVGAAGIALAIAGAGLLGAARPGVPFIPATVELRGEWWLSAIAMGFDSPIVGRGPNSYALEGVSHRTEDDAHQLAYDFTDDPHSVPLSMFANLGLLGLVGFVGLAVWGVRAGFSAPADPLMAGFVGSVVAYFVQSVATIDELSLRVGLWAALGGIGALLATSEPESRSAKKLPEKRKKRTYRREPLRRVPVVVIAALVPLAAVTWAGLLLVADSRAQEGRRLYAFDDFGGAERALEQALALRNDARYHYILALEAAHAATNEGEPREDQFEVASEAFGYLDGLPDLRGLVGYGRMLHQWAELTGADTNEAAREVYERAIAIDPLNPLIRAEQAEVLIDLGDYEGAAVVLGPATEVAGEGKFPEVWGTLALTNAHLGDIEESERAIAIALALKPDEEHAVEARDIIDGQQSP